MFNFFNACELKCVIEIIKIVQFDLEILYKVFRNILDKMIKLIR